MQLDDPLSDKEFNELDQFLLSDRSPEDSMAMDSLHGFFSAIAVGPEPITPTEWLPYIWGEDDQPKFKNSKEEQRILYLITRFMNEILTTLEVAPKDFEPLFCEIKENGKHLIDGEAWAWGFWTGIQLRPEAWQVLEDSEQASLLRPIYLLGAEEIEEEEIVLVESAQKRHLLAIEVEANLPLIHRFWLPRRKSGVETVKHETEKQGRNEPCSCGSGKKFKQCCGQNAN
jgi:uncharacterized protein